MRFASQIMLHNSMLHIMWISDAPNFVSSASASSCGVPPFLPRACFSCLPLLHYCNCHYHLSMVVPLYLTVSTQSTFTFLMFWASSDWTTSLATCAHVSISSTSSFNHGDTLSHGLLGFLAKFYGIEIGQSWKALKSKLKYGKGWSIVVERDTQTIKLVWGKTCIVDVSSCWWPNTLFASKRMWVNFKRERKMN